MINLLAIVLALFVSVNSKIIYTGTVIRHGARYPIRGDIYDGNASKQNFGKLTSVGRREQLLLGSYIRADYIDKQNLINSTLYAKEVQVYADGSERCQQSAISFLLGLFSFGSGEKVPDNLDPSMLEPPFESSIKNSLRNQQQQLSNGQFALKNGFEPVPYRSASAYFPKCPNENKIIQSRIKGAAIKIAQFQAVHAAFTEKMRIIFNLAPQFANIAGLAELFDVVTCDMFLGRQIPANFTNEDYKQLTFIQNYLFSIIYGGQAAKIFSTSVLSGMLANMNSHVNKKATIRYSLYSGHDTNIMPLLMFFNLTSPECLSRKWKNQTITGNCADAPPFASNVILQLHENEAKQQNQGSTYFVRLRYNGQYYNLCNTSSKQCQYSTFVKLVTSQMVDVNKECGITSAEGQQVDKLEILVQ